MEFFLESMVPGGGIEPTTLSLEGFCSSTELPGQEILKICKLHRYKNVFLDYVYLYTLTSKKFFCLEFLDFEYFSERRIARKGRKSNRFLVSLSWLLLFFFGDFLRASSRLWPIEIIYLVHIDDLPPLLPEEVSDDQGNSAHDQVCLAREHHVSEPYDLPEWDNVMDDEWVDDAEIEREEEWDKECHHQEHIVEAFHSGVRVRKR